jgi:hypothetical protein
LEVEDAMCRLDRQLGEFCEFLDEQIGRGDWLLALSADHAVAPIPEFVTGDRRPSRRNPLNRAAIGAELEGKLRREFGNPPEGENYVLMVEDAQIYLSRNREVLAADDLPRAREIARELILAQPAVFAAVTADALQGEEPLSERLPEQLRKTFHRERSGDVLFVLRPYFMQSRSATTHGSPWRYDTHVPLVFLGRGVAAARPETPASPAQLGPTLAGLLGLPLPAQCVEVSVLSRPSPQAASP